jgi:hypothetical protein
MDSNMQLHISSYCDPNSICNLCASAQGIRSNIKLGICLPRALLRSIDIMENSIESIQSDMTLIYDLLQDDPLWITEIWRVMSDYLYRENIPYRRNAFRRPPTGSLVHRMTLAEARDPLTWSSGKKLYKSKILQHEIYRMDRIHLRMWRKHAPTAIALIY